MAIFIPIAIVAGIGGLGFLGKREIDNKSHDFETLAKEEIERFKQEAKELIEQKEKENKELLAKILESTAQILRES